MKNEWRYSIIKDKFVLIILWLVKYKVFNFLLLLCLYNLNIVWICKSNFYLRW